MNPDELASVTLELSDRCIDFEFPRISGDSARPWC